MEIIKMVINAAQSAPVLAAAAATGGYTALVRGVSAVRDPDADPSPLKRFTGACRQGLLGGLGGACLGFAYAAALKMLSPLHVPHDGSPLGDFIHRYAILPTFILSVAIVPGYLMERLAFVSPLVPTKPFFRKPPEEERTALAAWLGFSAVSAVAMGAVEVFTR